MSMQITLIGLVVFILVIIFERRRLGILADHEQQRTDAVKRFWEANERRMKVDRELSQKVQQALDGVATLMELERQRATLAAQRAAGPMTGTGPDLSKGMGPVGGFTDMGVYRENGNPVAWYDPMRDEWKDRSGKVVPDPTLNHRMQNRFQSLFGAQIVHPQSLASISTLAGDDYDEQAARRRRASEAAFADAQIHGIGIMQTSSQGDTTHIPVHEFRGSGGTFDGGGASGNYDSGSSSASDSCSSSSSSSSSSDSSSSCSSSDSGGSSYSSD